jgi:O6-methylguanine-DNA--protein-cysteine methyltransferase
MGRLYKIDINIDVVEKLNDVDYGDRISYDDIKAALDKMNLGK